MKSKLFFSLCITTVAMVAFAANHVLATSVPSLLLSSNTGSNNVQMTIVGADPNVSVLLNYPVTGGYTSGNIGTTNASGYLSTTISGTTYNITAGSPVYVTVDGQNSASQSWPTTASATGGLSLSQTSLILSVGQSSIVSAGVSAPLTMSNNTNPLAASVWVNGNQITVNALAYGSTNITICASGLGCGMISVSVQSQTQSNASISFSSSTVSVGIGQSVPVTISGSGPYYIQSNSNSALVSASINGSTVLISGINVGTANVGICTSSGTNSSSCESINVNVLPGATSNSQVVSSTLSFSQNEVDLSVGQTQTVQVNGLNGIAAYVSNNSASSVATANLNINNSLTLYGSNTGGSNITVCTLTNICGSIYVYVQTANGTPLTNPVITTSQSPTISSFTMSSNNNATGGNFISVGNIISLSLSANQSINTPTITISGMNVSVAGSGSGPYTTSYSVTNTTALPIPVTVSFTNPAGVGSQAYFWLGNSSTAPATTAITPATAVNCPAGLVCMPTATPVPAQGLVDTSVSNSSSYTFNNYLYIGMNKIGQSDPDVVALQNRLAKDGLFSGASTGYFGPLTKAAVEAYQTYHSLSPLGVVGPATRNLLNQGI